MSIKKFFAFVVGSALLFSSFILPASAAGRTVDFSGYTWNVKTGNYGPGPNWWTDDVNDVFVDSNGALHLKIVNRNDTWYSSEVYLSNSLGYGKYRFETLGRVDVMDPNAVLGLFLYQDDTHEIDIEFSRWGWAGGTNEGFTVQPYTTKGNHNPFNVTLQDGPAVHEIDWQADKIIFKTIQNDVVLKEWTYTGANNFVPGKERLDINFWLMSGLPPLDKSNAEVVIKKFEYVPVAAVVPAPAVIEPVVTVEPPVVTAPAPAVVVEPAVVPAPVVVAPVVTVEPTVVVAPAPVVVEPVVTTAPVAPATDYSKFTKREKKREERMILKKIRKEAREAKKELKKDFVKKFFRR